MKPVLLAVCVCLATILGNYYYLNFEKKSDKATKEDSEDVGSRPTMTETDLMAVPVIAGGQLKGFFFARIAYSADINSTAKFTIPMSLIVNDSFYFFVANNASFRFPALHQFNVDKFVEGFRNATNDFVGAPVLKDVYLTQIDFFSGDDVRKKSIERQASLKAVESKAAKESAHEAAPSH